MSSTSINENKSGAIIWEEARNRLLRVSQSVEQEMCPLHESLGRVLAEDLISAVDQPPFRRSAMDGYAVYRKDIAGASPSSPVTLTVAGCLYAGDAPLPAGSLKPGEAVRIMTGAPVPCEADQVIRQEDTDEGETTVRVRSDGGRRDYISRVGEDFANGEHLISAGSLIDAYALSCACAAGFTALPVRRKIRAGLIMTGSELVPPGQLLPPGKIYNSSEAFLRGRLSQLGCATVSVVYAEDDCKKIMETIHRIQQDTDLIITTGGVSVGKRDLVPEALVKSGADILFHGIAIKPGMPTLGALCGRVPVLGLSGNPYSAAAVFELLGRPLIRRMLGQTGEAFAASRAVLDQEVVQNGNVPRVMMGFFDGRRVKVPGRQRNAQMKYGIGSNCVVILPPGPAVWQAGEEVEILL